MVWGEAPLDEEAGTLLNQGSGTSWACRISHVTGHPPSSVSHLVKEEGEFYGSFLGTSFQTRQPIRITWDTFTK